MITMFTRHRLFVLTDIENEPDDTQSLVRLLLYSNEIDIEGLVAVTSTWLRLSVHPEGIRKVLKGYEEVQPKLSEVDKRYPTAAHLEKLVGQGIVKYGMEGVGEEFDSDGSRRLIEAVDRRDSEDRPLHVALWGGANCLAQALWRVRKERTAEEVATFIDRIRVYAISDQDDAGPWIRRNFPLLHYVVSVHGENIYLGATWLGFSAEPIGGLPGADPNMIKPEWLKTNIQQGPLGSCYPDIAFAMEGDTPSYLACIPNGLSDPERPDIGGWGGRHKLVFDPEAKHYHDAVDSVKSEVDGSLQRSAGATIWRWRSAVQNDFASRMRWTIDELDSIERPPVVIVDGDDSLRFIERECKVSETLEFDASKTFSLHGANLSFKWYQYKEIDSILPLPMEVPDFDMHGTENTPHLKVTLPASTEFKTNDRVVHEKGRVYHIILEVTSEGKFPLTRYRRICIDVRP